MVFAICWVCLVVLMKIQLLSWTVRVLNKPRKREIVKNLLWDWRCDVVCLQETKLDHLDLLLVQSIWSNPYVGWEVINVVNTARSILLMWEKRVVEKVYSYQRSLSLVLGKELLMGLSGLVLEFMVPQGMLIEEIFGLN